MEGQQAAEEAQKKEETFCGITSSSREEALFYLESHNWDLDSAIHTFFESSNDFDDHHNAALAEDSEDSEDVEDVRAPPAPSAPLSIRSDIAAAMPSSAAAAAGVKNKDKKPSGSSRIRTLSDISGADSDTDSDDPQEYYTGGEKSGMLVQDPSKGNHDVDAIFDQAKKMGAKEAPFEHQHPSLSSGSFTGTGRLLSGETVPSAPQQPENMNHNIYFWSNGFTVNDGPLRRFDDPDNAPFLESIRKSECPKELEPVERSFPVHVNLIRKAEKYPEPVKRQPAFQGAGRILGSGTFTEPDVIATAAAATATVSSSSASFSVDDSLPSTSIQLRLADGTRMVARFNTHHTVGDIRAFVDLSRPGAARSYRLQTVGFPPKQLTDLTQTIEQAGLANSVVIQNL